MIMKELKKFKFIELLKYRENQEILRKVVEKKKKKVTYRATLRELKRHIKIKI